VNKDKDKKRPAKEAEEVKERTDYRKPELTKRGDLKEITALSFNPPG
jgi:hypothetical protein